MTSLLAFSVGPLELVIVMAVILLLFGNRLPRLMRSLGQSVVEFKQGFSGDQQETQVDHKKRNDS